MNICRCCTIYTKCDACVRWRGWYEEEKEGISVSDNLCST